MTNFNPMGDQGMPSRFRNRCPLCAEYFPVGGMVLRLQVGDHKGKFAHVECANGGRPAYLTDVPAAANSPATAQAPATEYVTRAEYNSLLIRVAQLEAVIDINAATPTPMPTLTAVPESAPAPAPAPAPRPIESRPQPPGPVPECEHGERKWIGKHGWAGWFCPLPKGERGNRCQPIWVDAA